MAIEFHCDHCGHKVRTSSENAGKRGRCPSCHQSVYIPTPSEDIELLRLAPLDEDAERQKQRLLEKSREVVRSIREERTELPAEAAAESALPEPEGDVRLPSDVETLVTQYILCMSQGELDEAEELARDIRRDMARADEFIQRLTIDELPPARLAGIPRALILGFIKQLRE